MKRSPVFLAVVMLLALVLGCQGPQESTPEVDLKAEEAAVIAAMNQFWHSFESLDINLVSEVTGGDPDMVIFGTDAAERWVGPEQFRAAMEQQFAALESFQPSLYDEVFKIHECGEVAWYSGIADIKGISQGEAFDSAGIRVTAVLEKRDSRWVIVQYHGSVPVAGQVVEY